MDGWMDEWKKESKEGVREVRKGEWMKRMNVGLMEWKYVWT